MDICWERSTGSLACRIDLCMVCHVKTNRRFTFELDSGSTVTHIYSGDGVFLHRESPVGGIIIKIKPRLFVICSAVCFFIGFLTASMTQNSLWFLYIGFGVLCGLGAEFAYNTIMSTVCSWFPDRQGRVAGILLMGFGLSSFIIGKIYTAATPSNGSMGWCVTFRFMGIIIFVIMVICSLFFVRLDSDFMPPSFGNKKIVREPASDIPVGKMVRTRSFWMFYIWIIMTSAAGLALVSQASGIAVQVGPQVSDGTIATVVGLISIMHGMEENFIQKIYRNILTVRPGTMVQSNLLILMKVCLMVMKRQIYRQSNH